MDRKIQVLVVGGIAVAIAAYLIDIYLAGIVVVILATLVMCLMIMQDSTCLPDISAEFRADGKSIILRNTGNSTAIKLHVALVPENIEFDVPSLAADAEYEHAFGTMIREVKVVLTFENEKGDHFSRTFKLSSFGEGYEPLKPMIPLFGYK
jgi:hypothetical protein